jgi:hypothetical protein
MSIAKHSFYPTGLYRNIFPKRRNFLKKQHGAATKTEEKPSLLRVYSSGFVQGTHENRLEQ